MRGDATKWLRSVLVKGAADVCVICVCCSVLAVLYSCDALRVVRRRVVRGPGDGWRRGK